MSGLTRSIRGRVDRSPPTLALAAGDVALVTLFVVLGEVRHYPLELVPARTPGTLVPFLVGWALASVLAGVYAADVWTDRRAVVLRTAAAWVVAVAVAQALRATAAFPGDAAPAFVLVSLVVGLALLVPWRVAVAHLRRP